MFSFSASSLTRFSLSLLLSTALFILPCSAQKNGKGKDKPAEPKLGKIEKELQGRWECDSMFKGDHLVDHKKLVGEILMKFEGQQFFMSIAGEERQFTYALRGDTIAFTDVKNYPNLLLEAVDKKNNRLVTTQYYPEEDFTIRWVMVLYKEK